MCWLAEKDFEREATSASLARRWVAGYLDGWGVDHLIDVATLLTSELVSNAVVHASTGPTVEISISDRFVEVGVSDRERRMPRVPSDAVASRPDDLLALAEGGRGLLMVDALADEWGATSLSTGKSIWFRLDASAWEGGSDCRCSSTDVPRKRLRSGRRLHDQAA